MVPRRGGPEPDYTSWLSRQIRHALLPGHTPPDRAGSTPLHLAVAPSGASGTAGAGDYQLEIVRLLLAAGATLADVDRNGIPVADRIQSQALRNALAAGQL